MSTAVLKRVVRRETHSPRTVASVVVVVLLALSAVYAGVEIVLHLVGAAPLLVAPGAALAWLQHLPEAQPQSMIAGGGVVVALAGAILLWLALAPGRRARHQLAGLQSAVVADNRVIASAIAERVRRELDLSQGAVVVEVGHRSADVTVRPEPGHLVEKDQVRIVAESELSRYDLAPQVRVRARVARTADGEGAS